MTSGPARAPRDGADSPDVLEYRLAPAYGLRILGTGSTGLAIVVVLAVLVATVDSMDLLVLRVIGWVGIAVLGGVTALGAWLLLDRRPRLRLDGEGVLNRTGRAVGVRRFGWKEVADVARTQDSSGAVLVVTLTDGRTSRIHASLLDAKADRIEHDIRTQANRALGYRPL